MATPVSEFYAKLGIRVDQRSLKAVDKFFSDIEKRMGKLGTTLSGTRGTVAGLAGVAKETEAVAKAERKRSIERSRQVRQVVADNNKLFQSEKKLADLINKNLGIGQVSGGLSRGDRQRMYNGLFGINSSLSSRSGKKSGAFNRLSGLRNAESSILNRVAEEKAAAEIRRKSEKDSSRAAAARIREQERFALKTQLEEKRASTRRIAVELEKLRQSNRLQLEAVREENRARRDAGRAARRPSAARTQRGNYLAIGGAGGAFARYGVQSLPFVGGAYGISQLNTANQQLMSREISSGAIFGERATQAKEWLRKHADYVGYNYLDTMPIFTQFMAGAMPTMGYETGLGVFEGLTEFGRTRGADAVGMQRAMRAVSQMSSKGTVTSEELKLQLSEATGFGESMKLFAEAWQIKSGGSLTGADAQAALLKAMERGEVRSADILPLVGKLMKTAASSGIDAARTSSIAEQARAQNAQGQLLATFSQNGGEAGFANFWREWAKALQSLKPLVEGAAGTFERLSTALQGPVRLFGMLGDLTQSLSTYFNTTNKEIVTIAASGALLATKWGRIAAIFTTISLVLEDIAFGVMGKGSYTKLFMIWLEEVSSFEIDQHAGIFGLAAAFATLAASAVALRGVGAVVPDFLKKNNIPGTSTSPSGSGAGGVSNWRARLAATAAIAAGGGAAAYGGIDQTDLALTGLALTLPKVGVPALVGKNFVFDPLNELHTQYRLADVVTQDPSSPAYGLDSAQLVRSFRSYIRSDSSLATDPSEFADFAESYVQSLKDERQFGGGAGSSQVSFGQGAVQINVTSNDPQKFSEDVKRILESEYHDAMIVNGMYGG